MGGASSRSAGAEAAASALGEARLVSGGQPAGLGAGGVPRTTAAKLELLRRTAERREAWDAPALRVADLDELLKKKQRGVRNLAAITMAAAEVVKSAERKAEGADGASTSGRKGEDDGGGGALEQVLATLAESAEGAPAAAKLAELVAALRDAPEGERRNARLALVKALREQLAAEKARLIEVDDKCAKRMTMLRWANKLSHEEAQTLSHGYESGKLSAMMTGPNAARRGDAATPRARSEKKPDAFAKDSEAWSMLTPMQFATAELRRMGRGSGELILGDLITWVVRIQSYIRMIRKRRFFRIVKRAVLMIQRVWRGHRVRSQLWDVALSSVHRGELAASCEASVPVPDAMSEARHVAAHGRSLRSFVPTFSFGAFL